MKVAITSSGDHPDSSVDRHFGRCRFFVVYDTVNKTTEFIPNPNINKAEGAGPASVELIAGRQVSKVVSGEFGAKVKPLFDQLQVQLISLSDNKTVRDVIELLEKGQYHQEGKIINN